MAHTDKKPIITEYLAKTLIDDAQTRIIKLKNDLQTIAPQLEAYKQAYEKLQTDHDQTKSKLEQEEVLLDFLSRGANDIPDDVDFRVMRAESHNDMKDREKKKLTRQGVKKNERIPWTSYAVEVLRDENKFVDVNDLWEMVEIKYDIVKRIEKMGKNFNTLKWGAINACWLANVDTGKPQLTRIGEKLGLIDWVDHNGKVKPEYRKNAQTN